MGNLLHIEFELIIRAKVNQLEAEVSVAICWN